MTSRKVIPIHAHRRAEHPLVHSSPRAYSNPHAGIAMQADQDAVHVLVGTAADGIELSWSVVETRRIARQLMRLADAAEVERG